MQREKVYYYNYYIILTEELHATCRLIGESFVDKTHAPTDWLSRKQTYSVQ